MTPPSPVDSLTPGALAERTPAALAARRRVLTYTLGYALAWLVAVALVTTWTSRRIVHDHVALAATGTAQEAHATARMVDRLFTEMAGVADMVTRQIDVAQLLAIPMAGAVRQQADPRVRGLLLHDDPDVARVSAYLERMARDLRYGRIYVMDHEGITLAASDRLAPNSMIGSAYPDRPYFQAAVREGLGRQYVVGRSDGIPGFVMASRIADAQGVVLGAVGVRFDARDMAAFLDTTGVSLIVDRQSRVITASQGDWMGRHLGNLVPAAPDADRDATELPQVPGNPAHLASQRPAEQLHAEHWRINGADTLVHVKALSEPRYRLVTLASLESVADMRRSHLLTGGVIALLGLLLLAATACNHLRMLAYRRHELHQAESNAAFMQALIDRIPNPIFYKDDAGRFTGCNQAYELAFGQTSAALRGKTVMDIDSVTADARRSLHEEQLALVRNGGMLHREATFRFADGRQRSTLYSVSAIRMGDGSSAGLVGVIVDITELKEAQREVREASERLQVAQEAGGIGLFDLDLPAGTGYWTPEFERLYGQAPGSFQGTLAHWITWVHPDDLAAVQADSSALVNDPQASRFHLEFRVLHPGGAVRWLQSTGRLQRDAQGRALRVIGVNIDVTDLVLARNAAGAASQAKSEFLANMSHEIRTPMNAIIGMSLLAQRTQLTLQQRDYLTKIQQSGQHLMGILNDILDFSKVEAGKMEVEHVPFELERMLDTVANVISERAQAKQLELVRDVAPDVPRYLIGDPLRLGQVLMNYATNAVKFTETGEVGLVVRLLEQRVDADAPEVQLRFEVTDTGIGLSQAQVQRLFRSFEQADTSITRQYGGTGLGLAICKRLAELMGGEVGVDSVPGQGSTFWFTAWLQMDVKRTLAAVAPQIDLRGLRVLVVDDNVHAAQVLAELLRAQTFEARTVSNGVDALAAVQAAARAGQAFDIVMLDWQMPGMDGLQLATRIRALEDMPVPRIVLVTAYGREEVFRSAQEAGIDHLMLKPVGASALFDTLMRVMGPTLEDGGLSVPAPVPPPNQEGQTQAFRALEPLRGARILLVEDNALNQQVATELLHIAGFHVDVAEDGLQARQQILATLDPAAPQAPAPYDLVLMDMQMPVMDGISATQALRRDKRLDDLPILAMTANAMPSDRQRCMAAGMQDFLAKPIEPEELWEALARWIRPRDGLGTPLLPGVPPASTPAPPTRDTGAAAPPASTGLALRIPGLDTHAGLRRVMGKRALYLSLLERFSASQASALQDLRAALDRGARSDAERMAHTLKGVAGNIGAVEVSQRAAELEEALRHGHSGEAVDQALLRLAGPLDALRASLASVLAPDSGPAPPAAQAGNGDPQTTGPQATADAPDRPRAPPARDGTAVLQQLELLLADSDAEALELLTREAAVLRTCLGPAFDAVHDAAARFDFEEASELLQSAEARSAS